jgi:hypothetical protein
VEADLGQLLVGVGIMLVVVGVLVWTGALSWFGRLPGDIRISGENIHVYIPITSCLILSLLLTIVLSLFRR